MKGLCLSHRKCSVLLAAGVGATVCLTGGGPQAVAATGFFKDSNTVGTATGTEWKNTLPFLAQAFGNTNLRWGASVFGGDLHIVGTDGGTTVQIAGNAAGLHSLKNPNVTVNSGLNWFSIVRMSTGTFFDGSTEKYYAVRFSTDSGTSWNYGWWRIRYLSSTRVQLRNWGYNNSADASIMTLADSVTARKLDLSDGRVKLHWTNANEDGVARYEVQTQDAAGAWRTVSSETPGAGAYSATVPPGSLSRVVIEKVDGTSEEAVF